MSSRNFNMVFRGQMPFDLDRNIEVELLDKDLWDELFRYTNEMFATPFGRSMIPDMRINITGLDLDTLYCVCMDFKPNSNHKWRYSNGNWISEKIIEFPNHSKGFMHSYYFLEGMKWMKSPINFCDLKISIPESVAVDPEGKAPIVLKPFARYVPVIKIIRMGVEFEVVYLKAFEECQFIVVANYQNNKMIELKGKLSTKQVLEDCTSKGEDHSFIHSLPAQLRQSMFTFVQKQWPIEEINNFELITDRRIFPKNGMNFFTFVNLFKIKRSMTKEKYSIDQFIEEIKNNSLNLPSVNLNTCGATRERMQLDTEAGKSSTEGAVGGTDTTLGLSEKDNLVFKDFQMKVPGHYIVDNAYPLENFLIAYLKFSNLLPNVSEEAMQRLRDLIPTGGNN